MSNGPLLDSGTFGLCSAPSVLEKPVYLFDHLSAIQEVLNNQDVPTGDRLVWVPKWMTGRLHEYQADRLRFARRWRRTQRRKLVHREKP